MTTDTELLVQLDVLKQQFAAGLPTRLDRIDTAIDACVDDATNETALAALVTALHSLGGAAGIFGFTELGDQARDAERRVMQWAAAGCNSEQLEQLRSLVLAWRQMS